MSEIDFFYKALRRKAEAFKPKTNFEKWKAQLKPEDLCLVRKVAMDCYVCPANDHGICKARPNGKRGWICNVDDFSAWANTEVEEAK